VGVGEARTDVAVLACEPVAIVVAGVVGWCWVVAKVAFDIAAVVDACTFGPVVGGS